jgi:ankyrin repeat protein
MILLIESVLKNDLSGLQTALAQGADPNERDNEGRSPLIHAAIDNRLEAAELLLGSGADPDAQDEVGNSALHYAAQEHHPEMAVLLIGHRAIIDVEDIHGNTPLWRAVFNSRGRGELINILLGAGANKHHRNKRGKTPMELAQTIANYNILQYFT